MPPIRRHFRLALLAFLVAFALLIGNTAAGLAGGLTRSLAFTATAGVSALAKIAGLKGFDMFHNE